MLNFIKTDERHKHPKPDRPTRMYTWPQQYRKYVIYPTVLKVKQKLVT